MKKIVLPPNRPYEPRVFRTLLVLNVVAAFAIIPFAGSLREAFARPGGEGPPGWGAIIADRIVSVIVLALLARLGLALSNRIGLGLPFVESRVRKVPSPRRFRGVFAVGLLVGIACAVTIVGLELGLFNRAMLSMLQERGLAIPEPGALPPLHGFMAAISAGITEETIFRLFGLSLLAWLGGLVIGTADGRPRPAVLWGANILFALVFAAAHLADAHAVGWPMNALVLTRTLVLNSIAGIAFGWLFWTYGLESAMLAHFFTDVGLYTFMPIIMMQDGAVARALACAVVAIVVVPGVIWAARTVRRESGLPEGEGQQTESAGSWGE